ncbi:MAG TPA: hypothetical protein DCM62_09770 [Bacteroidales bacterium]|nr:hypothetical protein [Bacteroidales bacterium]
MLTGCSVVMPALFGIRKIEEFKLVDYKSFLAKIPSNIEYVSIISSADQFKNVITKGADSIQKKDLSQPIQILYFKDNQLKSFHANCYAQGVFGRLNWNTFNRFEVFLPKSAIQYDASNILLENYKSVFPEIKLQDYKDYTIIIFWTNLLRRISLDAIETVIENLQQFDKLEESRIYLINTDKFFTELASGN